MYFARAKNWWFICLFLAAGLVILWLPYAQWGFIIDDFGLVWHSKIERLQQLGKFFSEMGLHTFFQPANYVVPEQTFFAVLYRPVLYVFYALQYLLFGFNAYAFLGFSALLHTINAWLLFIILQGYVARFPALLGSLYFLFHLSMLNWFGWVTAQQHILALFFLLVGFIAYKKFEASKNYMWLVLLSVSIIASIFTRETALVIPCWALFSIIWFWKDISNKGAILCATWLPIVGYLGWRVTRFRLKSSGDDLTWVTKGGFAFFTFLKEQFLNYVTWVVDLVNLGFMGGGHRLRKGSLIILVVVFLIWLFVKCRKKSIVLFLLMSSIALAWPAVIRFYTSRFMYEALPLFVMAIVLLVFENDIPFKPKAWCFAGLIMFNAGVFPFVLHEREKTLAVIDNAFKELVVQLEGAQSVCFAGLPFGWFCTGTAQACYMYGLPESVPVYYDKGAFVWSELIPDKEPVEMQATLLSGGVLEMKLKKPQKFSFQDRGTQFGTKECIDGRDATILRWDMRDDRFVAPEVVVTWDYEKCRFKKIYH
jgi:hypothetical protein